MPSWLKEAIFYEIYPQSFYDSNDDGIGDIPGIIMKLDYIRELGCNAIWLNPVYDSPFFDAGYDVRDHKTVAKRYGTNEDLYELIRCVHERDMRIILDLVPGHTSIDHPWFLESQKAAINEYSGRYIFTQSAWDMPMGYRWESGLTERDGNFMVNFFSTQPALNYGFYDITDQNWQSPPDHPDCIDNINSMLEIMRFWLDKGADGFRVDMADSLVKNDEEKIATSSVWRKAREMLDNDYPDAVLVAEWSYPERAINMAGFHMDFYLDHQHNGYHSLFRKREDGVNKCYVGKNQKGDITRFTSDFIPKYESIKNSGYICFITCNHDTPRLTRFLDKREIMIAYAMIFTMPGVPFLYYGDEIGMRYVEGLVSKEAGYNRTGTRTPMQWSQGKNMGFSNAQPIDLYLPIDNSVDAPNVESQEYDPTSFLSFMKSLIALRCEYSDLDADADFEVIHAEAHDPLFVYRRGKLLIFVNTGMEDARFLLQDSNMPDNVIFEIGNINIERGSYTLSPQSFVIINSSIYA